MTKKIFEGVVNGQVYKTVGEYNAAINKAIEAGVPIEANTTTRIEVIEDEKELDFHNVEGLDFLPDVNLDAPFDEDLDVEALFEQRQKLFDNLSPEDFKEFLTQAKNEFGKTAQRLDVNQKAMDALQAKLDVLEQANSVLEDLQEYYNSMIELANAKLLKSDVKTKTKCTKTPQSNTTSNERVKQLLESLGLM